MGAKLSDGTVSITSEQSLGLQSFRYECISKLASQMNVHDGRQCVLGLSTSSKTNQHLQIQAISNQGQLGNEHMDPRNIGEGGRKLFRGTLSDGTKMRIACDECPAVAASRWS